MHGRSLAFGVVVVASRLVANTRARSDGALAVWVVAFAVLAPAAALAQADATAGAETGSERPVRWWGGGQLHSAFVSDAAVGRGDDFAFGVAASAGHRPGGGSYGYALHFANTWWVEPQLGSSDSEDVFDSTLQGMIALGVGVEDLYFDRHMRLGVSIGPTLLLRDTKVDQAGTVGGFVDFRPVGIRFRAFGLAWTIDPLSLMVAVPDTNGIPLVLVHYNTVLAAEFDLEDLGS